MILNYFFNPETESEALMYETFESSECPDCSNDNHLGHFLYHLYFYEKYGSRNIMDPNSDYSMAIYYHAMVIGTNKDKAYYTEILKG